MAYKHIWYRNFNGGPFLGLTEVKFDSGTDARAFESVYNTLKMRIERNTPRGGPSMISSSRQKLNARSPGATKMSSKRFLDSSNSIGTRAV